MISLGQYACIFIDTCCTCDSGENCVLFCSILVHRANEWLGRHSSLHIVNVEVIEVSGVYGSGSSGCVESVKNLSQTALPAYLKMLRYCCITFFCYNVCLARIQRC